MKPGCRIEQRELALDTAWELQLELPAEWPELAITASWLDNRMAEDPEGPERRVERVEAKPAVMDKRQLWLEFEWIA